jgi:hypothetical protein
MSGTYPTKINSSALRSGIPPYIFQSIGKGLLFHGVAGVAREYKLIMIALGGDNFGHILVG